jgi:hypothetical protein
MAKPYLDHLKSSKSLETTRAAVRAGFVAQALEKNRRATPFVWQARALKATASRAQTPADLLNMPGIQEGLLTAAGVSDKAAGHLEDTDKTEAIQGLIQNFLEPEGDNFVEELVFRFLLTKGDTLGGSMRNVGGFLAQCRLTRSIIGHLRIAGHQCRWLESGKTNWQDLMDHDTDIELRLRGLSWIGPAGPRTLIYNLTVPIVRNNIDLCLFDRAAETLTKETYSDASAYLALGELKGGIDPAGADEHWKTAHTALNRIRTAFAKAKSRPATFFIGAAVATKMATEIWSLLKKNELDNAANLTDDAQLASISRWLCSL